MANDIENWFDSMDEETDEPNTFGFDDGVTDAILTDVSLFESKQHWVAVQFEFTDAEGTVDNGYRVSVSRKKTDGSKMPKKVWQRNVFQLMRPLILSDKNYKPVLNLETILKGNAAVVEALQVLVDKMPVRVDKTTPDEEGAFSDYKFLKVEPKKTADPYPAAKEVTIDDKDLPFD